ncbi:MAG: MFS transporter, partial [Myxococcota bacterium]
MADENAGHLSVTEKVGYSLGDFASNFYWRVFDTFILIFYTDVFGIPAASAATLLLVTRIWDAVNDPMMGILADRTKTRWGRYRPWLIWMILPLVAAGVLTFFTPDLPTGGKIVYAYVTYILMMMTYTAINIPYSALMGVISPSTQERTSVSQFRFVGAFTGGIVVQSSTLWLVKWFGEWSGGGVEAGWPLTMLVYGIIAGFAFAITFATTKERVEPIQEEPNLRADIADVLRN